MMSLFASGMPVRSTAMLAGFVSDRKFGEPPTQLHPVAAFGSFMTRCERRWYRDSRSAGVIYAAVGVGVAIGAGTVLRRAFGARWSTVCAGSIAIAGRMLENEGVAVAARLRADDLTGACDRLGGLVGRSIDGLDENEIARAVVESIAENTVDAVTASVLWGSVGGATGVLAHRAVNTMDAMVGHRSDRYRRFGWASARLDDAVNWLPARATVIATMAAAPGRAGEILRVVRHDAHRHPSPNGGVVESAFAAALGVRLGGVNRYGGVVDDRGTLGNGPPPSADDIDRAARLARRVGAITAVGSVALAFGVTMSTRLRPGWSR